MQLILMIFVSDRYIESCFESRWKLKSWNSSSFSAGWKIENIRHLENIHWTVVRWLVGSVSPKGIIRTISTWYVCRRNDIAVRWEPFLSNGVDSVLRNVQFKQMVPRNCREGIRALNVQLLRALIITFVEFTLHVERHDDIYVCVCVCVPV